MKNALTIAGSDPTGGAGLQADLRVFSRSDVHGLSITTALTAQNTTGVYSILAIEASFIEAQLSTLLNDIRPDAVKTGMIYTRDAVKVIVRLFKGFDLDNLVIDPVTVSSSGRELMEAGTLDILKNDLFPLARVVTPNIYEASALSGINVEDEKGMEEAAAIIKKTGPDAVIITGGHLESDTVDLVYYEGKFHRLRSKKLSGEFHGTGCIFSAALAASLAKGTSVINAAESAKRFVNDAIVKARQIGRGMKLLNV
jgi:hydroxymethylpyrimidine/phosphomethylpyrimidine kinase